MNEQAFNPYLPGYEYVPDGEPHVFGDRLYIFGSHDAFGGDRFCTKDYVCWSAPVDDLANWTFHGTIYRKTQDPMNTENRAMYAPDVACGADGRFYLYYTLDFLGATSVAVADAPEGPYAYYGYVCHPDGSALGLSEGDVFCYDPGVLVDEDGRVHLYLGVAPGNGPLARLRDGKRIMDGAYHFELEADMRTLRGEPHRVAPGQELAVGTPYEGHAFFEASSNRRVGDRYYFIYSSIAGHELCYATCDHPDGDFQYGGTLVSIGDIGLDGRTEKDAVNYYGNTHGSIERAGDRWYVFYHRHTNGNQLSRQGCAEPVTIAPDGSIAQVEVTSCGLNSGWLRDTGTYSAAIACNLSSAQGTFRYTPKPGRVEGHPYFTQDEPDNDEWSRPYIANMRDGAWAAIKYFDMQGSRELTVRFRADEGGELRVSTAKDGPAVACIDLPAGEGWREASAQLPVLSGRTALYFTYKGSGCLDMEAVRLA